VRGRTSGVKGGEEKGQSDDSRDQPSGRHPRGGVPSAEQKLGGPRTQEHPAKRRGGGMAEGNPPAPGEGSMFECETMSECPAVHPFLLCGGK
jgi:hypothetical protein